MRRSKREKQKTDVWPDKKIFNPEFRKKSDARVYRVQKKRKQDTQQFQIHGSEKKQDDLKIVLTCYTANYKDIQQNYEGWTNKKKMKNKKYRNIKYFHLISYEYLKIL